MASKPELQQVYSKGIYHGLPVYPSEVKGLTAIVTGANGISGQHMVRALGEAPERWAKIYCLSRRPPAVADALPPNAVHIPLDFMTSPEEIGRVLKENGVTANYVFFYSYIQVPSSDGKRLWDNADEMVRVNTLLLTNFLEALPLASIMPKNIMLQTGAKNYGVHLGPAVSPQDEDDPRILLEPNFYASQEDSLWAFCGKHGINWSVARPSWVVGAVPDAAMNIAYPLAVYATVQKHLGRKLEFPSDIISWENAQVNSTALMNGYFEEWAALSPQAQNEAFNTTDDCMWSWARFWPEFAKWFGLEYTRPDPEKDQYQEMWNKYDPPPRGFGGPGNMKARFTLTSWAKQPEVQAAWREIATKHGLIEKELRDPDRVFGFADAALLLSHPIQMRMGKARKLGWHGFVDSSESYRETFEGFVKLNMLPQLPWQ
ncbi:NAD dependent epimerase/dehydratase family protein-like protein [Eremomyces bilateralis CBS 781.70]|uniref:NAD dependent epimerase/dehydratase family protein-like protein n=1 Tax=Eremomyces bilateralis CBS 781.70 TaxID=1392243 RepID=A0A6G1GEJ8_9PEZI|nr:NAD dependent epimerase/dehydratase family protein-like protein [Eremomyces bilateralis CBS 781.70]KAF1816336.1 NAD dependent epimerase/dehydratase family protein-like protein [Eremomyces bilateralis CBS 781.70]